MLHGSSASEVTTLWHYTNMMMMMIIIIIVVVIICYELKHQLSVLNRVS